MKAKKLILVLLVITLVSIGFWWFMRINETVPDKTNQTTANVLSHKSTDASAQVELPKAPAMPAKDEPVVATNDPQADLKTAIPELARLIRAGDALALEQNFTPPDRLDSARLQRIQSQQGKPVTAEQQHRYEIVAEAWDAIEGQIPTMNVTGDEATYQFTEAKEINGVLVPAANPSTRIFIKINGKWYLKTWQ